MSWIPSRKFFKQILWKTDDRPLSQLSLFFTPFFKANTTIGNHQRNLPGPCFLVSLFISYSQCTAYAIGSSIFLSEMWRYYLMRAFRISRVFFVLPRPARKWLVWQENVNRWNPTSTGFYGVLTNDLYPILNKCLFCIFYCTNSSFRDQFRRAFRWFCKKPALSMSDLFHFHSSCPSYI